MTAASAAMSAVRGMTETDRHHRQLRARLAELERLVATADIDRRRGFDPDRAEAGDAAAAEALVDDREELARAEIADIRYALQRVAAGRYGLCTSCGDPIAAARLDALPQASRCITRETATTR